MIQDREKSQGRHFLNPCLQYPTQQGLWHLSRGLSELLPWSIFGRPAVRCVSYPARGNTFREPGLPKPVSRCPYCPARLPHFQNPYFSTKNLRCLWSHAVALTFRKLTLQIPCSSVYASPPGGFFFRNLSKHTNYTGWFHKGCWCQTVWTDTNTEPNKPEAVR